MLADDRSCDCSPDCYGRRMAEGTAITIETVAIRIPSGRRARLESVVVDPEARGKGIGEALCRAAMIAARGAGATSLDLTSAPSRVAANRLYERMGFEWRETNVYRFDLSAPW